MGCVRMMKLKSFADMNGWLPGIALLVTVVQLSRDEIQNKKNPAEAGFLSDFGRDNFGRTFHCLVYPPNLSARVESMTRV